MVLVALRKRAVPSNIYILLQLSRLQVLHMCFHEAVKIVGMKTKIIMKTRWAFDT